MKRDPLDYAVSMLLSPLVCALPTLWIRHTGDVGAMVREVLADLTTSQVAEGELIEAEERITTLESEYYRVPGRRVAMDEDQELPAELITAADANG